MASTVADIELKVDPVSANTVAQYSGPIQWPDPIQWSIFSSVLATVLAQYSGEHSANRLNEPDRVHSARLITHV